MRRVCYSVAASLDGYIAGPGGEFDWIPHDPTVDFGATFARFDTVLLGRRTYDAAKRSGAPPWPRATRVYVFSRTLPAGSDANVTIVREDAAAHVAALRDEPGHGEIWLFGGGELFRVLLEAGQVDSVEVTVVPVLLGAGVPLLAGGGPRTQLALDDTRVYPSGMVRLAYAVRRAAV
jgi:dihydrofolate reductase